jgi:hypothetical protein
LSHSVGDHAPVLSPLGEARPFWRLWLYRARQNRRTLPARFRGGSSLPARLVNFPWTQCLCPWATTGTPAPRACHCARPSLSLPDRLAAAPGRSACARGQPPARLLLGLSLSAAVFPVFRRPLAALWAIHRRPGRPPSPGFRPSPSSEGPISSPLAPAATWVFHLEARGLPWPHGAWGLHPPMA